MDSRVADVLLTGTTALTVVPGEPRISIGRITFPSGSVLDVAVGAALAKVAAGGLEVPESLPPPPQATKTSEAQNVQKNGTSFIGIDTS